MTGRLDVTRWGGADRYVDLDGPIHYVDFGGAANRPRLVLVHGLGGSHLNWSLLAPLLAPRARVVAIDLLGFGLSHPEGRPTTVQANAKMLGRFVDEVVGGPAVLVGNSMGALVSIMLASRSPDAVAGVVLIDPALPPTRGARPDPAVSAAFAGFAVPVLGRWVLAHGSRRWSAREQVHHLLRLCCVDASAVPADLVDASVELAEVRSGVRGLDAAFLAAARSLLVVGARRRRSWAMIDALQAPVLLLHGAADRLVPAAAAEYARRRCPGWTVEIFPEVGHVPQLEVPAMTAERMLAWLEGPGAGAVRRGSPSGQLGGSTYPEGDTRR